MGDAVLLKVEIPQKQMECWVPYGLKRREGDTKSHLQAVTAHIVGMLRQQNKYNREM
jgi:hypothetical protein